MDRTGDVDMASHDDSDSVDGTEECGVREPGIAVIRDRSCSGVVYLEALIHLMS